jgi:hypothetical protein
LETRSNASGAGASCGELNQPTGLNGRNGADRLLFRHGRSA